MEVKILCALIALALLSLVDARRNKTGSIERLISTVIVNSKNTSKHSKIFNERPMIGVVTEPRSNIEPYTTYIMASYIKFLEAGGAQVVPVRYNDTDEETLELISKLNGIVLPGGKVHLFDEDGNISEYTRKGKVILDYAKEQNDKGVHYPILGICLGFEEIAAIEAPYAEVLGDFDAANVANTLNFKMNPKNTRLFGSMPNDLLTKVQNFDLTFNYHVYGVSKEMFEKYSGLQKAYDIIAVSYDKQGVEYIAAFEHKKYPIYATQFHPEKNAFIWKEDLVVPHSTEAVRVTQSMSNFFVSEARKNNNHFASYEEGRSHRVENSPILFTNESSQDIYLF